MASTERIGNYQVIRRLAVGGMGEVLLARVMGDDLLTPGLVVLKRTIPDHPNFHEQCVMLREEGRLALRLRHANLVETFRLEALSDGPLLVMEYLAGRSMAQIVGAAKRNAEPIPITSCLEMLRGAACGLHFAHTLRGPDRPLGLVHRDVSPANIFVTFDGRVKVIDFGVAKADDSQVQTSTGVLKGKLGYMAPEHAAGEPLDPRADLWSLGVVFWETVVAERLFVSSNPSYTMEKIFRAKIPSLRSRRPEIDPAVEALCDRLLSRDRDQRVPTAAALVEQIDALPSSLRADPALGTMLAQRFSELAETGRREAREAARTRRAEPLPMGVVDGGIFFEAGDDEAGPTEVLDASVLDALRAEGRAAADAWNPPDVPTQRVPMVAAVPADDISAIEVEVTELPTTPIKSPPRAAGPVSARPPAPQTAVSETLALPRHGQRTAPPTPRGDATIVPLSASAIGAFTFGVLAIGLGIFFAWLAERTAAPVYAAAVHQGALIVAPTAEDLPAEIPRDRIGQLRGDAPPAELGLPATLLHEQLQASGVAQSARAPRSPRATLAAALPLLTCVFGCCALAWALPAITLRRSRSIRRRVQVGLAALVVAGALGAMRSGALGFPRGAPTRAGPVLRLMLPPPPAAPPAAAPAPRAP